ncbi:hypothetical protein ACEPAF_6994 [Sanghuangporus sanghuang]
MPKTLSSDVTHAELESEEATSTLVWRPIKYKLKLGLKGWIVEEIVLPDPYEDNSNSNNLISEDLHDLQNDCPDQQSAAQKMSHLKNIATELKRKPGAPGLYYALRDPARWPNAQELVFTRYGANRWNFMGIYSITKSQQLSAKEFQSLSPKVQDTWFSNIWSHKWGDYTLAAIYLRKHQHAEPTDMEVEYYAKKKAALIHRKVTSNNVKQAFLSGAEKINVWTMKCIGYDEELKKRLIPAQSRQQRKRKASEDGRSRVSKHRRI